MDIYDGSNDKKIFPTKHTVAVISANRIANANRDNLTIRKHGREDWSLFYCEEGRLYFEDRVLERQQIWIYPPNVPQKYCSYGKDKAIYHYLHFTGSDLTEVFNSLEIKTQQVIVADEGFVLKIFANIEKAMTTDCPLSKITAEYNVLHLISHISESKKHSTKENIIKRVIDDMEYSFAQKYNAARYADMVNFSVSRFNHLFKEQTGISPYAFITNLRIKNASALLENTNMKIYEIARQSGFDDALYFTQAFKQAKGKTPSEYRKVHQIIY